MVLLPPWAPNLHPLVVHFPIAVLAAAVAVDAASVAMPRSETLSTVATWLYTAGAVAAVIAYFSGDQAASSAPISLDIIPLLHAHADWAFRATWSFVFFASIRLVFSYLQPPAPSLRLGALLLAIVGLGALAFTVIHGSRLVFEQGIGVATIEAGQRGNTQLNPR